MLLIQQCLAGATVRTVGLGEDHDGVLGNDLLSLLLCGGHGCGTDGGSSEEGASHGF